MFDELKAKCFEGNNGNISELIVSATIYIFANRIIHPYSHKKSDDDKMSKGKPKTTFTLVRYLAILTMFYHLNSLFWPMFVTITLNPIRLFSIAFVGTAVAYLKLLDFLDHLTQNLWRRRQTVILISLCLLGLFLRHHYIWCLLEVDTSFCPKIIFQRHFCFTLGCYQVLFYLLEHFWHVVFHLLV